MKILSSILIAIMALPICISIAAPYIVETKALIAREVHASMYLIPHNLRSEPAMMILIGTFMIAIAGIGRKKLEKKVGDQKNKNKLSPAMPPTPDPVPWKKNS